MSNTTWRLLHVGDQHNDSVAPSSRKDDYCQAIKDKMLEVRTLANEIPTLAVIWSGDMINKQEGSRVPYSLTNWLIDFFRHFNDNAVLQTENLDTMGNHDVKARPENWERQPIGSVIKSGFLTPLWTNPTPDNPTGYVIHRLAGTPIRVHGKLYSYQSDKPECRLAYYGIKKENISFDIASMHTELIPNGQRQMFDFTTPEMIDQAVPPEARPDLYVCGHVHDNLGVFAGSGFRCVNFGALSRGSIDEYNLSRPVQVAEILITELDRGKYSLVINPIVLKCAKPAAEAFYVEELKKKRVKQAQLVFLSETLNASNLREVFRLINPDEAINAILTNQRTDPVIEQRVRQYIQEAKEELGF